MFVISARFIGNFKLGDNINHNLRILTYLYQRQDDPTDDESQILRKPIIIIIGSICEAVLCDLHMRINEYTAEGVIGIDTTVLDDVRGKKIDKFEPYISSAKRHVLLGAATDPIYNDLDELRKIRNRVHIQNEKNNFEPDDSVAFSEARQTTAELTLEKLIKTISENHPRAPNARGYVGDLNIPWDEKLP